MPVVFLSGSSNINGSVFLWDNYANTATITSSNTAAQHPAVNVIDPATWSNWATAAASAAWISFDLQTSKQINSIGISGHNLFTKGAVIDIATSTNGTSFSGFYTFSPTNNEDVILFFNNLNTRYFRLYIQPRSTGSLQAGAFISNLYFGQRLLMPSAPLDDYTPLNHAKRYTKLINESLRGHLLGNRVVAAGASTSASWTPLSRTWVDNNIAPFKSHYDQGGTFFYASSPSKYPRDMGYCRANGDDDTVEIQYIEGAKLASVNLSLWSYVNQ